MGMFYENLNLVSFVNDNSVLSLWWGVLLWKQGCSGHCYTPERAKTWPNVRE